jgi:hypothetical protein
MFSVKPEFGALKGLLAARPQGTDLPQREVHRTLARVATPLRRSVQRSATRERRSTEVGRRASGVDHAIEVRPFTTHASATSRSACATNLVSGDTNGPAEVSVHDLQTGTTSRLSVDSSGNQADGQSDDPSINADGSAAAFLSSATNLVTGDTNDGSPRTRHTPTARTGRKWGFRRRAAGVNRGYVRLVGFNAGIPFHGYADVPACTTSHGCSRLSSAEAPAAYAFMSTDAPVTVC